MTALPVGFLTAPISHRGLHDRNEGRVENSASAFQAAIDAGYGIELDVQMSANHEAIVFHDYELGRLTNETGPVRQRAVDELTKMSLTGGPDTIPKLSETLKLIAGRVPLLVEVKDQDGALGPNTGDLEVAVAKAITGYEGIIAVMSFNPYSVGRFKDLLPNIPRGLVTCGFDPDDVGVVPSATRDRLRHIPDYETVGASFISHSIADLANPRITELKSHGVPILCWTVRDQLTADRALRVADNITFEGFAPQQLVS